MGLLGKWHVINRGRFAVTIAVIVIILGLYAAIGTIEYNQVLQYEMVMMQQ